jgi:hypothetical protein
MMAICGGCDKRTEFSGTEKPCGPEDLMYLPLYVSGSEGIWLCMECRIMLTNVLRHMRHVVGVVKLNERKPVVPS